MTRSKHVTVIALSYNNSVMSMQQPGVYLGSWASSPQQLQLHHRVAEPLL